MTLLDNISCYDYLGLITVEIICISKECMKKVFYFWVY